MRLITDKSELNCTSPVRLGRMADDARSTSHRSRYRFGNEEVLWQTNNEPNISCLFDLSKFVSRAIIIIAWDKSTIRSKAVAHLFRHYSSIGKGFAKPLNVDNNYHTRIYMAQSQAFREYLLQRLSPSFFTTPLATNSSNSRCIVFSLQSFITFEKSFIVR